MINNPENSDSKNENKNSDDDNDDNINWDSENIPDDGAVETSASEAWNPPSVSQNKYKIIIECVQGARQSVIDPMIGMMKDL